MDAFRTAYVYVRGIFAGALCETDEGYSFSYDEQYLSRKDASAVSLTLPLSQKTYTSKTLFPFFDGLIPEGWLPGVVSRNWKIDIKNRFGLLLVACKDGIGNVIMPEDKEQFDLAMNGKKTHIRRKDFLVFAEECGMARSSAEKMIAMLVAKKEKLLAMCQNSLLPEYLQVRT